VGSGGGWFLTGFSIISASRLTGVRHDEGNPSQEEQIEMRDRDFGFPDHFGRDPGWWFGGWLFFVVVVLGLVALGYFLYRRRGILADDPLRRAAARYATGKIERVEFERIRHDLDAVTAVAAAPVAASPPPGSEPPGDGEAEST
jgi:hypothetical protein